MATTNNTSNNSNVITLTSFGMFCKDFKAGEKALSCTAKSMTEYGIENAQNHIDFAQRFYVAIGAMMDLRQSMGIKQDEALLSEAEATVKKYSDAWFKEVGTRPAKNGETKLRPCYGTRYVDFAIYGEIMAQAMALVENDIAKVTPKFFELLVINTARILNGEKLGRVTEKEFKLAKSAANKAKAEKAKDTKKKNAEKAADEIDKEAAATAKVEVLEITLEAQIENIEKAIALVINSHATQEEKDEIVKLLSIKATEK
ncbi:MAG: hypothetical protein RSF40_01710 [Oscillospiraceae bacterium]